MNGLGDYVSFFPCPYPAVVDNWRAIPEAQIESFLPAASESCDCNEGMGALGALSMDGSGLFGTGLFSGGMNLSTWGPGEIAVVALGAFALFSMASTTKRASRGVKEGIERSRKRRAKMSKASEGRGFF